MIGRKTAALIAASIEAGALLATDDEEVIARYRGSAGRSGSPSSSTTTCSASGARNGRPARSRPTSPTARRRCRSSTRTSTPAPRTARGSATLYADARPTADEVAEVIAILERTGARDYTRDQARRYRDEALAELDAAGVVEPEARARLEEIIVSVISA